MSNKKGKKKRDKRKNKNKSFVHLSQIFNPEIIKVGQIDGLANSTIPAGATGPIIQKAFFTSLDERFPLFATNLLGHFMKGNVDYSINTILIHLKNQTDAYIYKRYPLSLQIRTNRNILKGTAVTDSDITDITGVDFSDSLNDLNPKDGERFVWLFRRKWLFGLYFDLPGKLTRQELLRNLGNCWKRLNYMSEYLFMASEEYFESMISDGWFPFIALRGEKFRILMGYYKEGRQHQSQIDSVVESFDDLTIDNMIQYWWSNDHFAKKKNMITDAINAYKSGVYTLAGKALSTELEGILRYAYNLDIAASNPDAKQNPNTFDLRNYLKEKSQERYSLNESLCFPAQFIKYLEKYTFKGFDLSAGNVHTGRHPVAHGVTPDSMYTKEFALKALLALDNAYFFLGKSISD